MAALLGDFSYVLCPADGSKAVEEFKASKSGGLTEDALRQTAEKQFSGAGLNKSRQKAEVARQMQEKGMDVSSIEESLRDFGDNLAGNVEIITLCLPTEASGFQSVSLYCDGNSSFRDDGSNRPNTRATALAQACGYKDMVIMGDCFIGKALDDERKEWERLDFTTEDVSIDAKWVAIAATLNKGKDMSKWSTTGSLAGMAGAGQPAGGGAGGGQIKAPAKVSTSVTTPAVEEVNESTGYNFKEDEDDVEIRMKLPKAVPSKNLLVLMNPQSLVIGLKSVSKTEGSAVDGVNEAFTGNGANGAALQGPILPEESAWSLENERTGRWLTITLAKKGKKTWGRALAK